MLKKEIKYTNFNGDEVTSICYFHFGLPELIDMELGEAGGLSRVINRIIEEKESKGIIELVKRFILDAYGVKSDDGERFEKSPEIRLRFEQTAAYEQLFTELSQDAEACAVFVNSMMPAQIIEQVEAEAAMRRAMAESAGAATGVSTAAPVVLPTEPPVPPKEPRAPWELPPSADAPQQ